MNLRDACNEGEEEVRRRDNHVYLDEQQVTELLFELGYESVQQIYDRRIRQREASAGLPRFPGRDALVAIRSARPVSTNLARKLEVAINARRSARGLRPVSITRFDRVHIEVAADRESALSEHAGNDSDFLSHDPRNSVPLKGGSTSPRPSAGPTEARADQSARRGPHWVAQIRWPAAVVVVLLLVAGVWGIVGRPRVDPGGSATTMPATGEVTMRQQVLAALQDLTRFESVIRRTSKGRHETLSVAGQITDARVLRVESTPDGTHRILIEANYRGEYSRTWRSLDVLPQAETKVPSGKVSWELLVGPATHVTLGDQGVKLTPTDIPDVSSGDPNHDSQKACRWGIERDVISPLCREVRAGLK